MRARLACGSMPFFSTEGGLARAPPFPVWAMLSFAAAVAGAILLTYHASRGEPLLGLASGSLKWLALGLWMCAPGTLALVAWRRRISRAAP